MVLEKMKLKRLVFHALLIDTYLYRSTS